LDEIALTLLRIQWLTPGRDLAQQALSPCGIAATMDPRQEFDSLLHTYIAASLHALAGANGIYDRYPIQRLFRDQHALAAHIGFSWDAQGSPWGLVALGGDFSSPTL
jgi:hypothetical protein